MSDEPHTGLPVPGARPQSEGAVRVATTLKRFEERLLLVLDDLAAMPGSVDPRWLAVGRTQIQQGFMAVGRSILQPGVVAPPEDGGAS